MKKILAFLLCFLFIVCLIPIDVSSATYIDYVAVTGLDYPTRYESPDMNVSVTSGCSIYSIDWYDKTIDTYISSNEIIKADHVYEVQIWVEANSGYEFEQINDNTPNIMASINGVYVTATKAYEYKAFAMVVLSYEFAPVPTNDWIYTVNLGSPSPVIAYPVKYDPISQYGYAGITIPGTESVAKYGISWLKDGRALNPNEKEYFQAGATYTYEATIQAKPGYKFVDYPVVTVCGQPAYYQFNYTAATGQTVYVSYTYPTLENAKITNVDISIPAPVTNEKPSYTQILGNGYESTNVSVAPMYKNGIGWTNQYGESVSPQGIDAFEGDTQYQVHIYLQAESGYDFSDNVSVTVNGYSANAQLQNGALYVEYMFPKTEKAHEHTPSAWRITQVYHYKVCTTCGEMLLDEDHKGGKATCKEKAKCSVCSAEYGNLGNCEYETKWTAQGSSGHAHICKVCGKAGEISAHTPGPEATETQPQKCTVCDYIITPAKKHTHKLTKVAKVPATCEKEGNIEYYTCSGCSDIFSDSKGNDKITDTSKIKLEVLQHKAESKWSYDAANHYHKCTSCDEALDKAVHEIENGKCKICGYDEENPSLNSQSSQAENSSSENSGSSGNDVSSVESSNKEDNGDFGGGKKEQNSQNGETGKGKDDNGNKSSEKERKIPVAIPIAGGAVVAASATAGVFVLIKKRK